MPRCPQCTKPLAEITKRCPSCMADLDLLVDYVNQLDSGLDEAERRTRAGDLEGAVWKYLEVLEVDPDNAAARKQVARVATVVRVFDREAPGRRWLAQVRGEEDEVAARIARWLRNAFIVMLILLAFWLGYQMGGRSPDQTPARPIPSDQKILPKQDSKGLRG
ncbi:MAG: hypothetical protein L0Z62_02080 [Gemmataceae bacterium]|nr:hypothetical protein [Gemmataceae bacterium]